MNNRIKFTTVALVASVSLLSIPVQAAPGQSGQAYGITNATLAASAGATASQLGISTNQNNLIYNGHCTLEVECSTAVTNKTGTFSSLTLTFAKVNSAGHVSTNPEDIITWVPKMGITGGAQDFASAVGFTFYATTNLTRDVIGGTYGLALINITNGNSFASISNPVVRVAIKNQISP